MFPNLINLDLSYNRLTGDDILALGLLESLRTLHLTGMNCDCVNIIIKSYVKIDCMCLTVLGKLND